MQQPSSDRYERSGRLDGSDASAGSLPALPAPRSDQQLRDDEPQQARPSEGQQPFHTRDDPADGEVRTQDWASSNSDEAYGTSPVNAMGAMLTGNAPLPNRAGELYGRSSVAFLMQEVSNQGRETPVESRPSAQTNSLAHPAVRRQFKRFAGSSLHAQVALPPRKMAEKFLDSYFRNHHIFYPWIHSTTFRKEAQALWTNEDRDFTDPEGSSEPNIGLGGHNCPPAVFFGALNAVFALGCEFSDLPSHEKDALSPMFFARMKELLVHEILSGGSIAHVQALLLAGQYLHCTQYPTQCWNFIGLACRIAIGLGLQSENTMGTKTQLEIEIRRRVWYGCLQMDM